MITDKIKNLFQYIEFLHSNIQNFKQFDKVINELHLLDKERNNLSPRNNFADKLKYDEVQAEIKDKFKVIQENIITPIRNKATELNICNFQNEPLYNWNGIESDIHNLKENFSNEDIPGIIQHKGKYLEFRTKTHCTYFQDFFFNELDEVLKELFDFFKESELNEFEAFETKIIQVNNIRETVELFHKGHKKFTLPIGFLNSSIAKQNNSEALPPQQTETKTEQETEQETIETKPVLKPETVQIVFDIIKDFFSTENQPELKRILVTGNKASNKLQFKDNGNRLTDTFKKLIEHDFIPGCQKQDLINWIILNFKFTNQNKAKVFKYDTVEKTISRNGTPCKSPLIKIENGQIQKVEQPRTKKYSKY